MELTQARLKELLHYDPETGVFAWKVCRGSRTYPGMVAGRYDTAGYLQVTVEGRRILAHRLAWFYVHGEWPTGLLDHRDRDSRNNRFLNLRPATRSQNAFNANPKKCNKSGVTGVSWKREKGKWEAYISVNRKRKCLGYFSSIEDAAAARAGAEAQLNISEFTMG